MRNPIQFRSCHMFLRLIVALLIPTIFLVGGKAWAANYTAIEVAELSQGSANVVRGANAAGIAVGAGKVVNAAGAAGPRRALRFGNGGPQAIPGLNGTDYETAFGVNDVGTVVGASNKDIGVRGFLTTQAGETRELPPLGGDTASTAFAINNGNQAVGFSSGPGGERAALWTANGAVTALPGAPAITMRALSINARGDIAGVVDKGAGRHAVVWTGASVLQELNMLPGYTTSEPSSMNTLGAIVGHSGSATGVHRATLWPSLREVVDLGALPGGNFSEAFAINDQGEIVGTSGAGSSSRAVLWTSAGIQDLNTLIPPSPFVLIMAVGINNSGMIVAIGHDASHEPGPGEQESHEAPTRVYLLKRSGV